MLWNVFVRTTVAISVAGFALLSVSSAWAVNNAPADAAVVNLRTSCTEGGIEVPNCFTTMANVDNWLRNVRQAGPTKPTLVQIGPGKFGRWSCGSSHVTLKGSGRDRTVISGTSQTDAINMETPGCTNLNVQDLTVDGSKAFFWGVVVNKVDAISAWTNVEIIGSAYGWVEFGPQGGGACTARGRHLFFSSRISAIGGSPAGITRAYTGHCAESWFWGSELTANVIPGSEGNAFALQADDAEIHLYGSNARLILSPDVLANSFIAGNPPSGTYLMAALNGSAVHIHGTGLDVVHKGSGTADMLYADAISHFHANESGFNIHVTGTGKVNRVTGPGVIETPYSWGAGIEPPLSASSSGVQTLASRNGMDSYMETDCPLSATDDCSAGTGLPIAQQYPRLMVYRKECAGTAANQGPWFDTVKRACRN